MLMLVGLGNPGQSYEKTRHNAGQWLVESVADKWQADCHLEKKFHGLSGLAHIDQHSCRLLIPTTFMNHSGLAVAALMQFFKEKPENLLVAHDDLDLPPGEIKLKSSGGHGGHNGLRDIVNALGTQDFMRLRIGIGHPGHRDHVLDYVLGTPSRSDNSLIQTAIERGQSMLPTLLAQGIDAAMNQLHGSEHGI